jgi:hypothetical protein
MLADLVGPTGSGRLGGAAIVLVERPASPLMLSLTACTARKSIKQAKNRNEVALSGTPSSSCRSKTKISSNYETFRKLLPVRFQQTSVADQSGTLDPDPHQMKKGGT